MANPIQQKIDERVSLIKQAGDFLNECEKSDGGLTPEQDAQWKQMHDDAMALGKEIESLEAARDAKAARAIQQQQAEEELAALSRSDLSNIKIDTGAGRVTDRDGREVLNRMEAADRVINAWSAEGVNALRAPELSDALKASGIRHDKKEGGIYVPLFNNAPRTIADIVNAQSIGTTTAGGHLTAPGFVQNLERALLDFGGVRQVATILRTSNGSALDFPTMDDTSNTGALISENVQMAEQDVAFGNTTLDAYKYTSRIVRVSVELEQDSEFNMPGLIGSVCGERLGRIQNTHLTTGTGSSQPNGIVTASTAGKTAASATVVTMDELKDLKYSVDPAYRAMGPGWMWNDTTMSEIAKLTDGNTNYYFQPRVTEMEADRLFGHPITINQDMGDTASSTKSILFGAFSKYVVREVMGVTLVRLTERYADYGQVGYVAIMRLDGDLIDAGTAPVKHLVQAA